MHTFRALVFYCGLPLVGVTVSFGYALLAQRQTYDYGNNYVHIS